MASEVLRVCRDRLPASGRGRLLGAVVEMAGEEEGVMGKDAETS